VSTSHRRTRELQAREELILDQAQILFELHGYQGLNLDELAERVEYSKGTLYQHFESKEDLLLAVSIRYTDARARLFRAAARYPGVTRERMAAMGIVDFLINERTPQAFSLCQLSMVASIWDKASSARQQRLMSCLESCMEAPVAVTTEALLKGDIERKGVDPRQIVLGLITMSKGAMLVYNNTLHNSPIANMVLSTLQENRHRFLDGFGWRPFTDEHDYPSIEAKMHREFFNAELEALQMV
jgi:AcrR family transcriptional regulator